MKPLLSCALQFCGKCRLPLYCVTMRVLYMQIFFYGFAIRELAEQTAFVCCEYLGASTVRANK